MIVKCEQCGKDISAPACAERKFCDHACEGEYKRANFLLRFLGYVDRSGGPEACWEWQASLTPAGYGRIVMPYTHRLIASHRLAYLLYRGPIPDGLLVCHHCDNRKCCNPAHLFLGTKTDNALDMCAKGRGRNTPHRGEENGSSILTEKQVCAIRAARAAGVVDRVQAEQYGVSKAAIGAVVRRRTWAWLP